MKNNVWITWNPDKGTLVAFLTALFFICGGYYLLVHLTGDLKTIYNFIVVSLLVIFPVWWVMSREKGEWSDLGIKKDHWIPSLIISLLITGYFLWYALGQYTGNPYNLIPHFITNGLILWEPFFLFAWLQIRFDKAFGIIPGIIFTGLVLGAYHIGTYPLHELIKLALFGLLFAIIFRLTTNLLIMWPLTWSTSSAVGTLEGGFLFGWSDVAFAGLILLVQVGFMAYIQTKRRKANLITNK